MKTRPTRDDGRAQMLRLLGKTLCTVCDGHGTWTIYRGPKAGQEAVCAACEGRGFVQPLGTREHGGRDA